MTEKNDDTISVSCGEINMRAKEILESCSYWEILYGPELDNLDAEFLERLNAAILYEYNHAKRPVFFGLLNVKKYKSIYSVREYNTQCRRTPRHIELLNHVEKMITRKRSAEFCLKNFPETGVAKIHTQSHACIVLKAWENMQCPLGEKSVDDV